LTFPVSLGNVSQVMVQTVNVTRGSGIVGKQWTNQDGTYEPLGGTFELIVENIRSQSIPFNVQEEVLARYLRAMTSVNNVTVSGAA